MKRSAYLACTSAGLIVVVAAACSGSAPTPAPASTFVLSTSPPELMPSSTPSPILSTSTMEPTATGTAIHLDLEDILGTWSSPGLYMQFREDGSARFAAFRASLDNDDELIAEDEYSLQGNTIYLTGVKGYCSRLVGEYQVSLTEDGNLQFDAVDEECRDRRELMVTPLNLVER